MYKIKKVKNMTIETRSLTSNQQKTIKLITVLSILAKEDSGNFNLDTTTEARRTAVKYFKLYLNNQIETLKDYYMSGEDVDTFSCLKKDVALNILDYSHSNIYYENSHRSPMFELFSSFSWFLNTLDLRG